MKNLKYSLSLCLLRFQDLAYTQGRKNTFLWLLIFIISSLMHIQIIWCDQS